jgi:hypothetical protein
MVSTADWTTATRWPHIATRSARDAPVATRSQNARADRRLLARPLPGCSHALRRESSRRAQAIGYNGRLRRRDVAASGLALDVA